MINKSNSDSLNSLLLVQESLRQVASGANSLSSVLPDLLASILEAVGSRDGRLDLVNLRPDGVMVVTVTDGRVETTSGSDIPDTLKDAIGKCVSQPDHYVNIDDTLHEESWFATAHPEYTSSPWSAIIVPILTEQSAVGCLTILKPGQGSFVAEEIAISSLYAGQLGAALTNLRQQEEIRSAESRLTESLKDSHDLAAILVHDLQGPLGNVVTSLEMVEAGLSQQEDAGIVLMMDIAVRSSKHLQSLVDSLMDISRLEAGQEITDRAPLSVSELVDYVSDVEEPVLEQRQVSLAIELSPDIPAVDGNADILQRVLLNLVDNALKVSKQGQAITIRATIENDGSYVQLRVGDQGPGIPEVDRERVFEKYQRVDSMSASKGLGLGLAFCKLAVEAHGGQIWVEDSPDEGACFCFTLPVAKSPNPTS